MKAREQGGTMARKSAAPPPTPPKFFELIPPNPGIDFVGMAPKMALASCLLILVGVASIYFRGGLNYGIDFTGGTMVHVRFPSVTSIADLRTALDRPDLRSVSVQDVGGTASGMGTEFHVRAQQANDETSSAADAIKTALKARFGEGSYDILRVESVGPKVGRDLWRNATLAVLAATIMMGVYIAIRFDLPVGVGAAAKLIHDVLFTLGAISLANMEFDLTTVAALLTVVGFSVNDNVIISDRIRESRRKNRNEPLAALVNQSINETLSRTVINSGTVVLTTTSLFLLGGPVIHSFAFALLIGFLIGTFSSIFISTPIVLSLEGRRKRRS
jgi:preprotein translocase subunit SecF